MAITTKYFKDGAAKALESERIQANLAGLYNGFHQARIGAAEATPDWEELSDRGRAIKAHALENLDYYLELLETNLTRAGGKIFFANDAEEATRYVVNLARARGVRLAIKGKSMVSEEMELNQRLVEEGIEPVETDLGEYILQLAGDTPYHIIAPAIHKSREDVSDLFREKLNTPHYTEIGDLAREARTQLRQKFIQADMGITGANFLVAETGSFMVLENEGNARLCTSLPKVHVAITGIEKVIPRLADLDVFLRLLPRSATGQAMTTYQTLFTGPKPGPNAEGPEAIHLVLLDNGRSNQLTTPLEREALACIRCGACLNVCPVYKQVGGHAYGSVYPGPIGAVITPALAGQDRAGNLPHASSLCSACRDVCPVKINLPELLLDLREKGGEAGRSEAWGFGAWSRVASRPRLSSVLGRVLTRTLRLTQSPGGVGRCVRKLTGFLIPPLRIWQAGRALPPMPARSFRQIWKAGLNDEDPPA